MGGAWTAFRMGLTAKAGKSKGGEGGEEAKKWRNARAKHVSIVWKTVSGGGETCFHCMERCFFGGGRGLATETTGAAKNDENVRKLP